MIRSFSSRIAVQLLLAFLVAVTGLFLARDGTALASSFSPTDTVSVSPTTANTTANITLTLDYPSGDSRWAQTFFFTPGNAFIAPGPGNPSFNSTIHPSSGAMVGTVTADVQLGLTNSSCSVILNFQLALTNETVLVGSMPPYIETIFTPDGGNMVQPLARYQGTQIVSAETWTLDMVVFSPGDLNTDFAAPHPYKLDFTTAMGYPMAIILSNPNSPVDPPTVTATTDSCTQETLVIDLDGVASDGNERYRNPPAGTWIWKAWFQSFRDIDGDGIENPFDTCPYDPNADGDPRSTKGPDDDMLDSACDPTPSANTGGGNHDGDGTGLAPWLNAGDNCPLVANGSQAEDELNQNYIDAAPDSGPKKDNVGDACDTNPTVADGQYHVVDPPGAVCISDVDVDADGFCASDDPNDGDPTITPEQYLYFNPMPGAHSGAGGGLAANPASNSNAGEPYQLCNDGVDNDGDGNIDLEDSGCDPGSFLPSHPGYPACPTDGCEVDTDGDGFTDEAEINLGTDALGRCGPGPEPLSAQWPLDLDGDTPIPNSIDRISITDLTSFLAPVNKLGSSPGQAAYDPRFDLVPGKTFPFPTWIALNDLTAVISGAPGFPPMFNGTKAFGAGPCSAHPQWGD